MVALVTTILSIVAVLLELYVKNRPSRKVEAEHEATQQGRSDLVAGNVSAVEQRIDVLLTDSGDSPAGLQGAEDIAGRISRL